MATAARVTNSFLAIDFETANYESNNACSAGLVRIDDDKISEKVCHLIRPSSKYFAFTHIHGLIWNEVEKARSFGGLWLDIEYLFDDVDFVVAHNVSFDGKILHGCCDHHGIKVPNLNYVCSMMTSREAWGIYPTKLSDVCRHLSLKLNHHEALSIRRIGMCTDHDSFETKECRSSENQAWRSKGVDDIGFF